MDVYLELSADEIGKKNKGFSQLTKSERELRVIALLELGFVWNPHYSQFENPFYNLTAAADVVNFPSDQIRSALTTQVAVKSPKSFEQVEREKTRSAVLERLNFNFLIYSIIIGPVIFLLGTVLWLTDFQEASITSIAFGTLLIYYWVSYQIMYRRTHSSGEMAPIWNKYDYLFRILRVATILTTAWVLYTSEEVPFKYYILGAGVLLVLALNIVMARSIINEWWWFKAHYLLEKYYRAPTTIKDL